MFYHENDKFLRTRFNDKTRSVYCLCRKENTGSNSRSNTVHSIWLWKNHEYVNMLCKFEASKIVKFFNYMNLIFRRKVSTVSKRVLKTNLTILIYFQFNFIKFPLNRLRAILHFSATLRVNRRAFSETQ